MFIELLKIEEMLNEDFIENMQEAQKSIKTIYNIVGQSAEEISNYILDLYDERNNLDK